MAYEDIMAPDYERLYREGLDLIKEAKERILELKQESETFERKYFEVRRDATRFARAIADYRKENPDAKFPSIEDELREYEDGQT